MKKTYMIPNTAVYTLELQKSLLDTSNLNIDSNEGNGLGDGEFLVREDNGWDLGDEGEY